MTRNARKVTLPYVSVIVVNYNGRTYLDACLRSLAAQSYPRDRIDVIFVDNASSDGSAEYVEREYPWARVLRAGSNLGFAGGNNLGWSHARGEWVALLNADADAEPDWLAESVRAGSTAADIGGVAGHLVFRDEPTKVNSTGLELYRDGRAGDRDFGRVERTATRPGGDVFGGCGAALVLRRQMLEQVGLFDDDLFMYYEDTDLAWRANRRGWRFVYAPRARVRHVFGGSAGVRSPLQIEYVERNRAMINLRHAPWMVALATVLGLFARLARAAIWCILGRGTAGVVAAHARAAAGVVVRLPRLLWQRAQPGASTAKLFRRWARPAPR